MTAAIRGKQTYWSGERDEEGHRTYKVKWLVKTSSALDGPAVVLQTPGLPLPGTPWIIDNDVDLWAYCRGTISVTPKLDKERGFWWDVEQVFSNKPPREGKDSETPCCANAQQDDPLLQPPRVSGSFVKYVEEATLDRFGRPIRNSAHEQIRGPKVEFDRSRPTVKIVQNVASFAQAVSLPAQMLDTVNGLTLWGLAPRRIKLSNASWDKKFHGLCSFYYERSLEFDIKFDTFDRELLDEGTKALNGHWGTGGSDGAEGTWTLDNIAGAAPDSGNPAHFIRMVDKDGKPIRTVLDGAGKPISTKIYGAITGMTTGNPITVTSAGHGLSVGNVVAIYDVTMSTEGATTYVNDTWTVSNPTANTFDLSGSQGTGAYVSGGYWENLTTTVAGRIPVEKYNESDFLLLGIPAVF